MRLRVLCSCLIVGGACAVAAPAAVADEGLPVDLLGIGDERVVYPEYLSDTHYAPSLAAGPVGDVNGDGIEDSAAVLDGWDPGYGHAVWVTFSNVLLPIETHAGVLPWLGFKITAPTLWSVVRGIHDVNGDLFGEVIVQNSSANELAVVFGGLGGGTVNVASLGSRGFRVLNAGPCPTGGGGTVANGVVYDNTGFEAIGDQNGDGVEDLLICDGGDAKVVYTPSNPAGRTVDADALGTGGYTLDPGPAAGAPIPARLGDLNGDGREDVGVVWHQMGAAGREVRAVGVLSANPGETVDLNAVAETGRGFELTAPDSYLENAISVGDQNGDGRRELGFVAFGSQVYRERTFVIPFSPALGTEKTIYPIAPADGYEVNVHGSGVADVGDQDGDGFSDIGYDNVIYLSSGEHPAGPPGQPDELGGRIWLQYGPSMIVGSLGDRNLDGKRELLVAHADPYKDDPPGARAVWKLDTFLSAPEPLLEDVEIPEEGKGTITFRGAFRTAAATGSRTLTGRAYVEIKGPKGTRRFGGGQPIDANATKTAVTLAVPRDDAGVARWTVYRFRLLFENSRGLVGASDWIVGGGKRIRGNRRANRLRGSEGHDNIKGKAGADRIKGLEGNDTIDGGPDDDRIVPGAGSDLVTGGRGDDRIKVRDGEFDVVRCGSGKDKASADKFDVLRRC